jgi:hypothetical protein
VRFELPALLERANKPHLIIFIISLVCFLSLVKYGLPYDEGYLLDGVERIMEGQVIYRDFHHTYAPGRFYLMGAAFSVAGKHIYVERFIFALLQALKCMLAFLVVRKITRSNWAYLAPLIILAAPGAWHKVFFSSLGLLSAYVIMVAMESDTVKRYVIAGLVAGACAVFRQDAAGFAVIGGAVAVAVFQIKEKRGVAGVLKRWLWLAAGSLAVIGAVFLLFYARGALGAMVHKIAVEGMKDNMTNQIPYPPPGASGGFDWGYFSRIFPVKVIFYMPPVVYALSACVAVYMVITSDRRAGYASLVCLLVTSVLAFNQATWRSDLSHVLQSAQYAFVLLPVVLWAADNLIRLKVRGGALALVRAAMAAVPVALVLWGTASAVYAAREPAVFRRFRSEGVSIGATEYVGSFLIAVGNDTRLPSERAPVYVMPAEARFFSEVRSFLDEHTAPGDYVLAVPQLQVIYFLFDRRNPTRYAHYRRALEPEEEKQYIEDIKRHETEFIFLTEPSEGARLADTKQSFSEYAAPVRDFILRNYTDVARIGSVRVLRRNR